MVLDTGMTLAGTGEALDVSMETLISEFKLTADAMGVFRSTATELGLKPHEGTTKNVLTYGRAQAYRVDDGADLAMAQAMSDALASYTPSEAGAKIRISGRTMSRVADSGLFAKAGQILARAYDLLEDTDGANQMASWTYQLGNTSGGDVMAPGHIFAAGARLAVGNNRSQPQPSSRPYFGVFNPMSLVAVAGRMIPLATTPAGGTAYGVNTGAHLGVSATVGWGANEQSRSLMREGFAALGQIGGVIMKESANIIPDSSDDAIGGWYSREGLVHVSEVEGHVETEPLPKSFRGAMDAIVWGSYIWGLYLPGVNGIAGEFDASLPTS